MVAELLITCKYKKYSTAFLDYYFSLKLNSFLLL